MMFIYGLFPIYTALDSSFVSVFEDPAAGALRKADELNPFTMSHTAKAISNMATGIARGNTQVDGIAPTISNRATINMIAAPIRPHTASHRGTSLV